MKQPPPEEWADPSMRELISAGQEELPSKRDLRILESSLVASIAAGTVVGTGSTIAATTAKVSLLGKLGGLGLAWKGTLVVAVIAAGSMTTVFVRDNDGPSTSEAQMASNPVADKEITPSRPGQAPTTTEQVDATLISDDSRQPAIAGTTAITPATAMAIAPTTATAPAIAIAPATTTATPPATTTRRSTPTDLTRTQRVSPAPKNRIPDIEENSDEKHTEAGLLGDAQDALRHDAKKTLTLIRKHRRLFAKAVLEQERDFLEINALVLLGKVDEATARGNDFKNKFPKSAHLRRLRKILSDPIP